jgi:hypothetical protein
MAARRLRRLIYPNLAACPLSKSASGQMIDFRPIQIQMYLGPFPKVSLADELADAKRELKLREQQVYPRLVEQGKMERRDAEHQIACQRAIVARLEAILELVTPQQVTLGL